MENTIPVLIFVAAALLVFQAWRRQARPRRLSAKKHDLGSGGDSGTHYYASDGERGRDDNDSSIDSASDGGGGDGGGGD